MKKSLLFLVGAVFAAISAIATSPAATFPAPVEGNYTIPNFKFDDGETLPELRIQ